MTKISEVVEREIRLDLIHKAFGKFRDHYESGLLKIDGDSGYDNDQGFHYPNKIDDVIAKALGHLGTTHLLDNMTDQDKHRLILLAGPNGWAIYQMLLAKQKEKQDG